MVVFKNIQVLVVPVDVYLKKQICDIDNLWTQCHFNEHDQEIG